MDQIKRIEHMEDILRRGQTVRDALEETLEEFAALSPALAELSQYYGSDLWFFDLDSDQQGLLPVDLRRGVLSEDAVYDLLSDLDRLREQMRSLASGDPEAIKQD